MARSILQSKNLHNIYCVVAVRKIVYNLNWSLTSSLEGITPYEAWYDNKPNIKHFRVFGCIAYAHIHDENRRKLDPNSEGYIFLSYCKQTKA